MFNIDYKDRRPIYEQLVHNIKSSIINGIITEDEQLPSVRQLSIQLAINPNTIQKAYTQLEQQGIIYSVKGKGSFIAKPQNHLINETKDDMFKKLSLLIISMKDLGIDHEKIKNHIDELYKGGEKHD
ncbi:MAG: GntR family transcriptional regulator [Filifactoraceae bacterium]